MFPSDSQQRVLPGVLRARLIEYRSSFRAALRRITPKELASHLPGSKGEPLHPESLLNQARDWNHRKHPSADAAVVAQLLDTQHAVEVASLGGYVIGVVPKMKKGEALRALQQRGSKGFVSAAELNEILGQTDLSDNPDEDASP